MRIKRAFTLIELLIVIIAIPLVIAFVFGINCLLAYPVIWAAQGLFDVSWTTDWYYIWRIAACIMVLSSIFGGASTSSSK